MKLGGQTQATPGGLEAFVRDTLPALWKLFGTALDVGTAQAIKRASPKTFLIGRVAARLDEGFDRPREQASAFAAAALLEFERFRGLLDAVEGINEPIVKDAAAAQRLNDWQATYSGIMNAAGWPVVAYNFNSGGPEVFLPNGQVDPTGGMWQYLHGGLRASQYLGLHGYGAPTLLKDAPYQALRYRAVWSVLPPDVRRPVLLTEAGLDFGLIGKAPSGFRANGVSVASYMQQLADYNAELERDSYVIGSTVFLFGSGAAQWDSFDLVGEDVRPAFAALLKSSQPVSVPPPPTPTPTGGAMDKQAIVDAAFHTVGQALNDKGIDYLATGAFGREAAQRSMGFPLGKEGRIAGTPRIAFQVFAMGVLACIEGDWGNMIALAADGSDYFPAKPLPPGTVVDTAPHIADFSNAQHAHVDAASGGVIAGAPPPVVAVKRLTTADLAVLAPGWGIEVVPYQPKPGELYWGLVQAGGFLLNVGTEFIISVKDELGAPALDVPITHAWDAANHFWKTERADGAGQMKVDLGKGSEWTPGSKPPPDSAYVSVPATGADGVWPDPAGDGVRFGMPGGHGQGAFTFKRLKG